MGTKFGSTNVPEGIEVLGQHKDRYDEILTGEAVDFVATLSRNHTDRLESLLESRHKIQQRYDGGELPVFLEETRSVREGDWKVAPVPEDLQDRRVEITGPVDRKMIINALNSGANVFMADLEDSNSPKWDNVLQGQVNLCDAVKGTITFEDPKSGKFYKLAEKTATLLVRPRGWHLPEKHFMVDGRPVPAGIFDFGLYFFHNAKELLDKGTGPYFYLPKIQDYREARLWNDIFVEAQDALGIPRGTIKATVLIETLPAAFVMDEILYELREHSSGLNCGRWDYIFSFIKTFRNDPERVLPDRSQVTMVQPFMRAYTQLAIRTCHRRGAHAMGGMAAQIPIKGDPQANEEALDKVRQDKLREVTDGHDGTWVAHPGLVPVAKEIFDAHMKSPNQLDRLREDVIPDAEALVEMPMGTRTEAGLRQNVTVGVQYLAAWLDGNGCVPLYNLMEDAATAEISRTQVWQWIKYGAALDHGEVVSAEYFRKILNEEMENIRTAMGPERYANGHYQRARDLFEQLSTAEECGDFLTLPAYDHITSLGGDRHVQKANV